MWFLMWALWEYLTLKSVFKKKLHLSSFQPQQFKKNLKMKRQSLNRQFNLARVQNQDRGVKYSGSNIFYKARWKQGSRTFLKTKFQNEKTKRTNKKNKKHQKSLKAVFAPLAPAHRVTAAGFLAVTSVWDKAAECPAAAAVSLLPFA